MIGSCYDSTIIREGKMIKIMATGNIIKLYASKVYGKQGYLESKTS